VTSGFVKTNNRYSKTNWAGFNDWTRNYADISPPFGFTMSHLQGFIASIGIIYFSGTGSQSYYRSHEPCLTHVASAGTYCHHRLHRLKNK
jgi:hypothetical protein